MADKPVLCEANCDVGSRVPRVPQVLPVTSNSDENRWAVLYDLVMFRSLPGNRYCHCQPPGQCKVILLINKIRFPLYL